MARLPVLKAGELMRALNRAGFQAIRQRGSHARLKRPDGRLVTIPIHSGQDIGRGLLRKVLRDAELTRDEFAALLR